MSELLAETERPSVTPELSAVEVFDHVTAVLIDDAEYNLMTVLGVLTQLAEELQDMTWHLDDYLLELRDARRAAVTTAVAGPVAGSMDAALSQVRQLAGDLCAAIRAAELAALDIPSR